MFFTPEFIAGAIKSPLDNVKKYWPLIVAALEEQGIKDRNTQVIALATIAVECRTFAPINELGSVGYFTRSYEGRKDLGNIVAGDGARFHGRGFVQITGRANYKKYGERLKVDLVNHPELALDAVVSARIFAAYFKDHGLDVWANKAFNLKAAPQEQAFMKCRRLVNGGLNGYSAFRAAIKALGGV